MAKVVAKKRSSSIRVSKSEVVPFESGWGFEVIIPTIEQGCVVLVSWGQCGYPWAAAYGIAIDGGPAEEIFAGWLPELRGKELSGKETGNAGDARLVAEVVVPEIEKHFAVYYK